MAKKIHSYQKSIFLAIICYSIYVAKLFYHLFIFLSILFIVKNESLAIITRLSLKNVFSFSPTQTIFRILSLMMHIFGFCRMLRVHQTYIHNQRYDVHNRCENENVLETARLFDNQTCNLISR